MNAKAKLPTGDFVPVADLERLGFQYYKTYPYYQAQCGQDVPCPEQALGKGAAVEQRERCWTAFLPTHSALER